MIFLKLDRASKIFTLLLIFPMDDELNLGDELL